MKTPSASRMLSLLVDNFAVAIATGLRQSWSFLVGPYACFLHDIVMMMSNFDTLNVYGKYCKRRIFREAQFLGQNNSKSVIS